MENFNIQEELKKRRKAELSCSLFQLLLPPRPYKRHPKPLFGVNGLWFPSSQEHRLYRYPHSFIVIPRLQRSQCHLLLRAPQQYQ